MKGDEGLVVSVPTARQLLVSVQAMPLITERVFACGSVGATQLVPLK